MIALLWIGYGVVAFCVGGIGARMFVNNSTRRWNQDKPDSGDYVFGSIVGLITGSLAFIVVPATVIALAWYPMGRRDIIAAIRGTTVEKLQEAQNKRTEEREVQKELRRVRQQYLAEHGVKLRKRKGNNVIPR